MPELPQGMQACGVTPRITKDNVPKELPKLPVGTWGKLVAKTGLIKYTLSDDAGNVKSCVWIKPASPVTIEPQTKYSVEMMGADTCFVIEFFAKEPVAAAETLPKALMKPKGKSSVGVVGVAVVVVLLGVGGYFYIKNRK
mmetsp:Transcript_9847/g.19172  ORF Transcript_9847/g.19172 Transcript_9847/m.19172 type:complete len:140 (+) Transcript_9847:3-422(+)